ncbi:MAG: tetratricopeptide repeat protein [Deltaproteobacteria bacterium]|nr:MAG: tetratricopeptide repeat protein [Deltaproteobacteria bacterium]
MMRSLSCAAALVALLNIGAAPLPEAPPDPRQVEAVAIYGQGEAQFKVERWDAAAALFQKAYDTWPDPAYLFNVGLSFEKGQRWPLAIRYYARFLAEAPDTPNRPDIERRLVALRKSREAERASLDLESEPPGATARVTTAEELPPCTTPCTLRVDPGPTTVVLTYAGAERTATRSLDRGERWLVHERFGAVAAAEPDRTGAIVSWAVGGAGLVTGIVFGVMAQGDYDDGAALAKASPLDEADYDKLAGHRRDLKDHSLIADIGFGVAAAGALVGVVLWVTGEADAPKLDARTGVGGVSWRF